MLLAVIYFSFICLGLQDSVVGAAWPSMYPEFGVSVSLLGVVWLIFSTGMMLMKLFGSRLTARFGIGRVMLSSAVVTVGLLFCYSKINNVVALMILSFPFGLSSGAIDAAVNTYVALHYESRFMNWLHCMWGLGSTFGPIIVGWVLARGQLWNDAFGIIGIVFMALAAALAFSLPMWKADPFEIRDEMQSKQRALSLKEMFAIPGLVAVSLTFFCYSVLEGVAGQWVTSYLVLSRGFSAADAAKLTAFFSFGIMAGRFISGFMTLRLNDAQMVKMGLLGISIGVALLFLPWRSAAVIGINIIGLGCAPIYPAMVHASPLRFGTENSSAVLGVQMASGSIGSMALLPVFGLFVNAVGISIMPFWLLLFLLVMIYCNHLANKQVPLK